MARSESRTVMEWKRGFAPPGTVPSPSGLAASAPPLRPCSQQQAEIQAMQPSHHVDLGSYACAAPCSPRRSHAARCAVARGVRWLNMATCSCVAAGLTAVEQVETWQALTPSRSACPTVTSSHCSRLYALAAASAVMSARA